jgi:hypothetical protein
MTMWYDADTVEQMKEETKAKAKEEAAAAAVAANAARIAELQKQMTEAGLGGDFSRISGQLVGQSAEEIKALILEMV